jgi:hypothetical protein
LAYFTAPAPEASEVEETESEPESVSDLLDEALRDIDAGA